MERRDEIKPRQIKDAPWCWQHKGKLTMIADIFDATNDVNSARTIYVALTEFASDNGSETFTAPIAQIARRAGVSYRTACAILNRFESLKLIAVKRHVVEGTKERAPSTYTMLGNQCITLCNRRIQARLPRMIKKNDDDKNKQKENQGTLKTLGNSTPLTSTDRISESVFVVEGYQNQNQPAQDHVKWPEFAHWCRSKGGTPTETGFWKWLCGQKPQWRNKVRQKPGGEEGYALNGKFFTREQANQRGVKNPELIEKFRKATKRDGKIEIIPHETRQLEAR
jgi:molybdenum-dependent DNA-binding transcriptional regulator ModE